jgi:hypothetical protein
MKFGTSFVLTVVSHVWEVTEQFFDLRTTSQHQTCTIIIIQSITPLTLAIIFQSVILLSHEHVKRSHLPRYSRFHYSLLPQ